MSGSHANSVALNPGGTLSGGNRFSVCGPVFGGSSPRLPTKALATTRQPSASKRRVVTAVASERNASATSFQVSDQFSHRLDAFVRVDPGGNSAVGFEPKVMHDRSQTQEETQFPALRACGHREPVPGIGKLRL